MPELAAARAWNTAAISLSVMALANALLLGYVHLLFAASHPDYYSQAWPSFSRALSDADVMFYGWIAAAAATCQVIGCSAVAYLRLRQARGSPRPAASLALTLAWIMAAALGIVHYLHMTIVVNSGAHMVLSYVFFFGMTCFVVADAAATAVIHRAPEQARAGRLPHAARGVAVAVVASGLVFLVTYFLKDAGWNPLPSQTQKMFVASEVAWVILCHVYVLICVRLLQRPALEAPRSCGSHLDMTLEAGRDAAGQGARSA